MAVVPRVRLTTQLAELLTRRGSLRVLAALLLGGGAISTTEAAHPVRRVQHRAAKRRQRQHHRLLRRRRQQRRKPAGGSPPQGDLRKGFSIEVHNHLNQLTRAELGIIHPWTSNCWSPALFPMPANTGYALYDTDQPWAYAWIEDRYFLGFSNPYIGAPYVWVGDGGSVRDISCHSGGTKVLGNNDLTVDVTVIVHVNNRTFNITRKGDKGDDFKFVVVDIIPYF